MLPFFLESCPNLKSLVVVRIVYLKLMYFLWYNNANGESIIITPTCFFHLVVISGI